MNKSSFVFALLVAVGLGGVIYSKQMEIAELERAGQSQRAGVQDLNSQLEKLRAELAGLRKQNEAFKAESEKLRSMLAEAKTAPAGSSTEGNASAADSTKKEGGGKFMQSLAKMFTDPEMKKSMKMQQMAGIRMMYGDLLKELGLTGQDAEQFLDVLAERQMQLAGAAMSSMSGEGGDKDAAAAKIADSTKTYDDQIKSILGQDRYDKFKSYESTMGDRFMLQQWEGQFTTSGSPLESNQKEQLLDLIRDERSKTPGSDIVNNRNPAQQLDAIRTEEGVAKMMDSQSEVNRRVLARAREFLNADQIATLEKVQQQQIEMMKMQAKMAKEFMGNRK